MNLSEQTVAELKRLAGIVDAAREEAEAAPDETLVSAIKDLRKRAEANEAWKNIVANVADSLERRAIGDEGASPRFCENAASALREAIAAAPAPPPPKPAAKRDEWTPTADYIKARSFGERATPNELALRDGLMTLARHVGLETKEAP